MREEALETARRFVAETEPFAYRAYNMACFYAQVGRRDLALAALREGLDLLPSMREWGRRDPELAPLRDDPAFQALLADTGMRQATEQ